MNTKTLLITGGAGFIGSAVIRELIQNTPHQIINLDKLTYASNLKALAPIQNSPRYTFEQGDICEAHQIKHILNTYQPDIIMHLAAETHVDTSINAPSDFIQTNILGTYTLLEQTRAYWQTLAPTQKAHFRFHHISTDEVYGDLPHPDDIPKSKQTTLPLFTENSPYAPSSPYSASKASADHLVRAWYRTYGLPTILSHSTNNYGPFQFPEKLIPRIILNALAGNPLPIYGKGTQIRDWLYVEDHAKALIKVATKGKIGETYPIGGQNEQRNIHVVQTICHLLDKIKPKATPYAKQITHTPDRPGHDKRYAMDTTKTQKELNWHPQQTFETGLKKTIEWYLKNK